MHVASPLIDASPTATSIITITTDIRIFSIITATIVRKCITVVAMCDDVR